MKNCDTPKNRTAFGILPIAVATTLALASTVSLPRLANAHDIKAPAVPGIIQVPAGHEPFLEGHGVGTQNYICLPSGSTFAWTLFTPQATLFNDHTRQVTTHYFSPNPEEKGTVRATWEHSRDSSIVWGLVVQPSSDPNFVLPGAIPWLLLQKAGVQDGPTGGDTLTETTYIQRVNTVGGSAPATGCVQLADVGKKAFIPYTADYFFFTDHHDRGHR